MFMRTKDKDTGDRLLINLNNIALVRHIEKDDITVVKTISPNVAFDLRGDVFDSVQEILIQAEKSLVSRVNGIISLLFAHARQKSTAPDVPETPGVPKP